LPGVSGLEFQMFCKSRIHTPIIFMTGHGDIWMSVKAMKAGAIDFLPAIPGPDMLDAVRALDQDRKSGTTRRPYPSIAVK
jgi:FixJ family two-component response regulator